MGSTFGARFPKSGEEEHVSSFWSTHWSHCKMSQILKTQQTFNKLSISTTKLKSIFGAGRKNDARKRKQAATGWQLLSLSRRRFSSEASSFGDEGASGRLRGRGRTVIRQPYSYSCFKYDLNPGVTTQWG